MGARETALNALMACRKSGAWSNGVLKEYIRRDRLDSRDAALATRLCYGVLQNRNKLDFYLRQLLTGRLKDLHPVVRDILHLGLYQIYELDKIPASAAVNESVALAKKYCKNPKAASLVNGVLRSAVRTRGQLKEPVSYADRYSHPDELISLLKANLPKGKLEAVLIADNTAPQTVVQVNTLRISTAKLVERLAAEQVQALPHGWMQDCLILSGTGSIENLPSFREGCFYVQDPASKLSVLCAELAKTDIHLLDCCAAPGGKSFAASIAMEGRGRITSCDIHAHKTELISGGAARLGLTNITARQQDATVPVPQWENAMDAVLADVPCSGLGIIRKKPDI
ncbi:MAG: transcription antitermination factor NusB, partial [Faecousia sp.]